MDLRGEELGRRRVEYPRESHSTEQSDRGAEPTVVENQKNCEQLPTAENNVSKKAPGPMTRDKDTESHRHIAREQALKGVLKASEHQVEIEEQIEVED